MVVGQTERRRGWQEPQATPDPRDDGQNSPQVTEKKEQRRRTDRVPDDSDVVLKAWEKPCQSGMQRGGEAAHKIGAKIR